MANAESFIDQSRQRNLEMSEFRVSDRLSVNCYKSLALIGNASGPGARGSDESLRGIFRTDGKQASSAVCLSWFSWFSLGR